MKGDSSSFVAYSNTTSNVRFGTTSFFPHAFVAKASLISDDFFSISVFIPSILSPMQSSESTVMTYPVKSFPLPHSFSSSYFLNALYGRKFIFFILSFQNRKISFVSNSEIFGFTRIIFFCWATIFKSRSLLRTPISSTKMSPICFVTHVFSSSFCRTIAFSSWFPSMRP